MPMGDLNAAPTFIAMMMNIKMKWDKLDEESGMENFASKIIFDYVLLYGRTSKKLLAYFRTVLEVLKQHRATLKLKK